LSTSGTSRVVACVIGVEGRSNRKCSMFGMIQTATRAPFGQVSRGRSTMAE